IHELLKAGRVDAAYLARYTNAGWLVVRNPGEGDDGLFLRDEAGAPLAWDRDRNRAVPALAPEAKPALKGQFDVGDRTAVPVFQLLAERYLDDAFSPDTVAGETGIAASTIRRIATELAHAAFEREVVIEQPWR